MTDTPPPKGLPGWEQAGSSPVVLQSSQRGKAAEAEEDDAQDIADVEFYKDQEAQTDYDSRASLMSNSFTRRLLKLGVEELGVHPIPVKDRTDTKFYHVLTLWVSMSVGLVPLSAGIVGTLSYGLSLRDASLTILFFSLLTCLPVAYLSTLGPKTGLRQMVQARYSFGLIGVSLPVVLNLFTLGGYCMINSILGAQTLAGVAGGNLSPSAGIVVVCAISLAVSFMGYKVLHMYEKYAWIPALICLIILTGVGGKHFKFQFEAAPADAPTIISFGALIAGFIVPYAGMASDFFTYLSPEVPSWRIFLYTYCGLLTPTIPLMVLGAAIGAATPNIESWTIANDQNHIGGILVAMLEPAGGFGKFVSVLLALSVVGNIAATFYSITLNCQVLFPPLGRIPRYVFSLVATAVIIPVAIVAASHFYDALVNFLGLIAYWSSAYCGIVLVEHLVFRKRDPRSYKHSSWNKLRELPTGIAAISAGLCSLSLIIPSMYQIWYEGPIAKKTGDIAFEMAFVVAALLYYPFRKLEIKLLGRI